MTCSTYHCGEGYLSDGYYTQVLIAIRSLEAVKLRNNNLNLILLRK